jgi:hypothetical protein
MRSYWQSGLLIIAAAGMECCWLYAVIALINERALAGRLSVIGLLLLYPVAYAFNWWLFHKPHFPRWILNLISWPAWVIVMLVSVKIQLFGDLAWFDTTWLKAVPASIANLIYGFRPELIILIASGVMWWLSKRLSSMNLNFARSAAEFQVGLALLLIVFFSASQLDTTVDGSLVVILVFFLFALVGLSLAHAREGGSWLAGLQRRYWILLLLASTVVVVALGFLISSIISPGFLQTIVAGFKYAWDHIVYAIKFLIGLLPTSGSSPGPAPAPGPEMTLSSNETFEWGLPENARLWLQVLWCAVLGGLLLVALWRVMSQITRWLRRRLAVSGVEMEPLTGGFRSDLLSLLKLLLARLVGVFKRRSKTGSPELSVVRQTYRQLLRWAAVHGYPRQTFQTPFEFYLTLADILPEARPDLDFITRQYVKVRYNAALPAETEIRRMKQSWHNIRQIRLKKKSLGAGSNGKNTGS